MTHPSTHYTRAWIKRAAPGFAAALILSVLASGCTEPEGSGEVSASRAASQPTPMELYVDHCASCHGIEGRGDGPRAAELQVAPINLRVLKRNNNGKFPTIRVQRSIDGRGMPRAHGLPDMPLWGRQWLRQGLREPEVHARVIAITSYISSIQD